MPESIADVRTYARWVREHPGTTLWMGHSTLIDAASLASYLAGSGIRVPFGFGVSLIPLMHPMHAAAVARSISLLSNNPLSFGVGISSQEFVRAVSGAPYRKPATAVNEYLKVMKAALSGQPFQFEGEQFSVSGSIHPLDAPEVEVGAGVLRPAMAERIRDVADFAITWLCPPSYIADVIAPRLSGSVPEGGKRPRLVASVQFLLDRHAIDPVNAMRDINSNHLRAPHYRDMMRQAGLEIEETDSIETIARRSVEADVFMYGSARTIASKLRSLADADVDEVVLNPSAAYLALGTSPALQDMDELLSELDLVAGIAT